MCWLRCGCCCFPVMNCMCQSTVIQQPCKHSSLFSRTSLPLLHGCGDPMSFVPIYCGQCTCSAFLCLVVPASPIRVQPQLSIISMQFGNLLANRVCGKGFVIMHGCV
jgi:hypothetical protein